MDVFSQSTTTTTVSATKPPVPKKKKHSKLNHLLATLTAWFVLVFLTVLYYYFVIPDIVEKFEIIGIVIVAVDVYLWLCLMGAMLMTTVMDPGIMPKATEHEELFSLRLQGTGVNRKHGTVTITVNDKNIYMKWCSTCHMFRPPRCSHCSICDRCIESFDHHCPWVNNCIGRRNYKHYVMLLIGVNVHLLVLISFSIWFIVGDQADLKNTKASHIVCYVYLGICPIALFIVGQLTFLHVKLVSRCQTTRERNTYMYCRIGGSPFRYGITKNWFIALCSPQYPTYTSYLPVVVDVQKLRQMSNVNTENAALSNAQNINEQQPEDGI